MIWFWSAFSTLAVFAASLFGTRALIEHLRQRDILDHPNARSSHRVPTPRGGGAALMAVLLAAWTGITLAVPDARPAAFWPLGGALVLAGMGWRDDLGGLPALVRFIVQIGMVLIGLLALEGQGPVFQGLVPLWLDRTAAGLGWLWFLNLFNFMDGIDGIAGAEATALGLGAAAVAWTAGFGAALPLYALAAAAAALGFLWWNWHPARVFMGDVGSVPLGYLLAWLLLELASRGLWAAALLLPLYYLADASLTLLRRLLRRERIWQAHQEHFYQKAVQRGFRHDQVVGAIAATDGALVALALWSTAANAWLPLALGALTVLLLLAALAGRKPA